jgi:uncharacterized protein with PIN domain
MIKSASFLFHDSHNDFLLSSKRNKPIVYTFADTPSIKHVIETIGIPHSEVDVILVNDKPVDFFHILNDNDAVEVFPANSTKSFPKEWSLTPPYSNPEKFILDVHLGKLAKALRLFGFDSLYENNYSDKTIVEIADKEERIILTRDRNLLKHKLVSVGYWLHSQHADEQLMEVIRRFDLKFKFKFFERCVECNCKIKKVEKTEILDRLLPKTILYYNNFFQCECCKRIYWRGSHYEHMHEFIGRIKKKISD